MAATNGDLEKGDVKKEVQREAEPNLDDANVGEYNNLVRYISTYREGNKAAEAAEDDDLPVKCHWWSKKSKDSGAGFETPQDWLDTDMRLGLRSADVESRRKKTGWNELTTEKENMFLKFLSYFQGPILYGSFPLHHSHKLKLTASQSWNLRSSLPPGFATGSISASSRVFFS
jgi:H+-transporting ATPase